MAHNAGASAEPDPGPVPDPAALMTRYTPAESELLHAVSGLVSADREVRRTMAARMGLNSTDMRALRFVMERSRTGHTVSPHDLADLLGISTAATTTLVDRLVAAGHLSRAPHPADRRSKILVPTTHARAEAHQVLRALHERMRAVAGAVPDGARPAVLAFLGELTRAMHDELAAAPPAPGSTTAYDAVTHSAAHAPGASAAWQTSRGLGDQIDGADVTRT